MPVIDPLAWRLTNSAALEMLDSVMPGEIGIGAMFGSFDSRIVWRIVPLRNIADSVYPARGNARAWAWDRAHASALQARPEDHGIAGAFVGMVHTHAHARPWPSTLDWRRPRAQDVFAIFHLGSGRVTFFRRGTTARQAALCGSVVIRYDASSWIRVSHGEAGDPSEAARRCGPVTSEVAL